MSAQSPSIFYENGPLPFYLTGVPMGSDFYFQGQDPSNFAWGLYKSDGTDAGTTLVKAMTLYNSTYGIQQPVALNGLLYFGAEDANGYEAWKSDGTDVGTTMIKDINLSGDSGPKGFFAFNNEVYFTACPDGTEATRCLWKTDGTAAGTLQLGTCTLTNYEEYIIFNNELYFGGVESATTGRELWKTDGTSAGTVLVKDINTSSPGSVQGWGNPYYFCVYNNELYFSADTPANGQELWKTDGTSAGTVLVKDIYPGYNSSIVGEFAVYNSKLFFSAVGNSTSGAELWMTDGTDSGTILFKEFNPTGDAYPNNFSVYQNKLIFTANNGSLSELWISDGTPGGTMVLSNVKMYLNGIFNHLFECNNGLYFLGNDVGGLYGEELWRTDGTSAGTYMVADLKTGSSNSSPRNFFEFNNSLYFIATASTGMIEQWYFPAPVLGNVNNQAMQKLGVHPNPCHDELIIDFSGFPGVCKIEILDSFGRKIKENTTDSANDRSISLDELPVGLYFVTLTNDKGETYREKFVKN